MITYKQTLLYSHTNQFRPNFYDCHLQQHHKLSIVYGSEEKKCKIRNNAFELDYAFNYKKYILKV